MLNKAAAFFLLLNLFHKYPHHLSEDFSQLLAAPLLKTFNQRQTSEKLICRMRAQSLKTDVTLFMFDRKKRKLLRPEPEIKTTFNLIVYFRVG